MKGIDISVHNGTVNFNLVKEAGIEVVIIKATEGVTFIDSKSIEHYNGALATGLNISFYHFMSEKTNPTLQAIDFYSAIKDKKYNVIPVLDIETNNQKRSSSEVTNRCLEFLNKFKELTGLECVIYTGGYFGRDTLDNRIKNYIGWIAHYVVNTPMATGFKNVVGHQYTEYGSCKGVNTSVDLNNFTKEILINNVENSNVVMTQEGNEVQGKVAELKRLCNSELNSNLVVDNIWGDKTEEAVKQLPLAGIAYKTPELTKWIQARVGCVVDGIYGEATEAVVKGCQSKMGLKIDGVVGFNTLKSLALYVEEKINLK